MPSEDQKASGCLCSTSVSSKFQSSSCTGMRQNAFYKTIFTISAPLPNELTMAKASSTVK